MRVRGRRLLAVLAGGVVLVGGGVTTLASWQDDAYLKAPVTTSTFALEQSVDNEHWYSLQSAASPSILQLTVGTLSTTSLSPDSVVVGWFGLRAAKKSLGATLTMSNLTVGTDSGGLGAYLTYEAVAGMSRDQCRSNTAPSTAVTLVPAGTGFSDGVPSTTQIVLNPGTDTVEGEAVGVCMRIRLAVGAPRSVGGSSISPVWKFHATSKD